MSGRLELSLIKSSGSAMPDVQAAQQAVRSCRKILKRCSPGVRHSHNRRGAPSSLFCGRLQRSASAGRKHAVQGVVRGAHLRRRCSRSIDCRVRSRSATSLCWKRLTLALDRVQPFCVG